MIFPPLLLMAALKRRRRQQPPPEAPQGPDLGEVVTKLSDIQAVLEARLGRDPRPSPG